MGLVASLLCCQIQALLLGILLVVVIRIILERDGYHIRIILGNFTYPGVSRTMIEIFLSDVLFAVDLSYHWVLHFPVIAN